MALADRLVVVRDDGRVEHARAVPPEVHEVERRSLLHRLAAQHAPLVVVCGPAGSGKSTLLRQWAGADPRPTVTVDLTARHDSPGVLADALVSALSDVGPEEAAAHAAITDDEPAFSAVVVPGLAEVLPQVPADLCW